VLIIEADGQAGDRCELCYVRRSRNRSGQTVMKNLIVSMLLLLPGPASAAGLLDSFSDQQSVTGLRQALEQGSLAAVAALGKTDGFLGNPKVRIPLPDNFRKVEKLMRPLGYGKQLDELETTMNRAAEAAVPEARKLFVDAVGKMTVTDAKTILTGDNDAGTRYFRKHSESGLTAAFLPIVTRYTEKLGLARQYNKLAGKAARFGLVEEKDARIEDYVTRKSLDGLFFMVAEEEKAIRANPVKAGGDLAKKIFGALGR